MGRPCSAFDRVTFFWVGELGGEFYTLYISSWLVVVGLCWLHMGRQKLNAIWFPLFISLAMFPLPQFLNTKITLRLKLLSSRLGVAMMQFLGMSAYREGNIIDLGFTQLQVLDACSGLRYFFLSLSLGFFLPIFTGPGFGKAPSSLFQPPLFPLLPIACASPSQAFSMSSGARKLPRVFSMGSPAGSSLCFLLASFYWRCGH